MKNLDLNRLHKVFDKLANGEVPADQEGLTTYACASVVGYLQVLKNTTIPVVLTMMDRKQNFIKTLEPFLEDAGIEIQQKTGKSLKFKNNSNVVEFYATYHNESALDGFNVNPIYDLG